MPVLQVFCPSGDEIPERLTAACVAVADALTLPPDGVVATHIPTTSTVRPGHARTDQVVVVVHSSSRDASAVEHARTALQTLADRWCGDEPAWVSWQTRS